MQTASGRTAYGRIAGFCLACIAIALIGGLSGCSSSRQTAYVREYTPPGPPSDPWGPYIREASARFSVPEKWIREVMRQESGGRQYIGGSLTTSSAGAAGLMQIMPATYAELRDRYGLGPDRYNPRDNILAGTAYIREMYDRYGYPGFLAAYNAGPGRLEDHLYGGRRLPAETRNYLASVAPRLAGSARATGQLAYYARPRRSSDELNRRALAALSNRGVTVASALNRRSLASAKARRSTVTVARSSAPTSRRTTPRRATSRRVADRQIAAAETGPGIQVGAFSTPARARAAADSARTRAGGLLGVAQVVVRPTTQGDGTVLYRAWLVGLAPDLAAPACDRLTRQGVACMVLTPERMA